MGNQIQKWKNSNDKLTKTSKQGGTLTISNSFLSGPQLSIVSREQGQAFTDGLIRAHLLRLNEQVSETERITTSMIKECVRNISGTYFFWTENDLKLAFDWMISGKWNANKDYKAFGKWDTPKVLNCCAGFEIERVAEIERIQTQAASEHKKQPVASETQDMLERYAIIKAKAAREAKEKKPSKRQGIQLNYEPELSDKSKYRQEWQDLTLEGKKLISMEHYVKGKLNGTL